MQVLGYDAWRPTLPGATALVAPECKGDADTCEAASQNCIREYGIDLVLNIWVAERSENGT
jgi:hypothetical protein